MMDWIKGVLRPSQIYFNYIKMVSFGMVKETIVPKGSHQPLADKLWIQLWRCDLKVHVSVKLILL